MTSATSEFRHLGTEPRNASPYKEPLRMPGNGYNSARCTPSYSPQPSSGAALFIAGYMFSAYRLGEQVFLIHRSSNVIGAPRVAR